MRPRSTNWVVKYCQNWSNLKVVFKGLRYMYMLITSMTIIARIFILQKSNFNILKQFLKNQTYKGCIRLKIAITVLVLFGLF